MKPLIFQQGIYFYAFVATWPSQMCRMGVFEDRKSAEEWAQAQTDLNYRMENYL